MTAYKKLFEETAVKYEKIAVEKMELTDRVVRLISANRELLEEVDCLKKLTENYVDAYLFEELNNKCFNSELMFESKLNRLTEVNRNLLNIVNLSLDN